MMISDSVNCNNIDVLYNIIIVQYEYSTVLARLTD